MHTKCTYVCAKYPHGVNIEIQKELGCLKFHFLSTGYMSKVSCCPCTKRFYILTIFAPKFLPEMESPSETLCTKFEQVLSHRPR